MMQIRKILYYMALYMRISSDAGSRVSGGAEPRASSAQRLPRHARPNQPHRHASNFTLLAAAATHINYFQGDTMM